MIKQLTFILSLFVAGFVSAQTITWNGLGATNNFSEGGNWVGGVAPSSTNAVLFNGTGTKNCTIDASITVTGFTVASGYSGIISGSTFPMVVNGSFSQAAGTFDATSDSLTVFGGSLLRTGGVFNAGTGNVILQVSTTFTSAVSGVTLNLLKIAPTGTILVTNRYVNFSSVTTSTLALRTVRGTFSYQGGINILSQLAMSGSENVSPVSNTGTFTCGGAGNFSITTSVTSAGRDRLPNLVFNTVGNIITNGAGSGNQVSVMGSWQWQAGTFVPGNVTISFFNQAFISGTNNIFRGISVQAGANLTFPAGETRIGGNVQIVGTGSVTTHNNTVWGFNGTGGQDITNSNSQTVTLNAIRVYTASGFRTITFATGAAGSRFAIRDSIKLDGNARVAANGKLILLSTSSLKARLARLGAGADVTGTFTVQTTVLGATTGWANMGTPGVAGQTVKSWDTYSASSGANGLPMTCSGCDWDENSISGGPFTSIQSWTESTDTYNNLTGTSAITPGVGYWVYVGNGQFTTTALTLVNSGTLTQGNVSVSCTNGSTGYNLVSNPYASAINWSTVVAASSNIANAIYIWNADLNTTTSFVAGVSSHVAGANNVIPAGQGFHVQATGGGASVNFTEASKIHNNTSANPLLRGSSNSEDIGDVFRLKLASSSSSDYMAFRIHNQASEAFDTQWDALKRLQSPGYLGYPGPYTKYTTLSSKDKFGVDYSVHSIAPPTSSLSIPVMARVETSGTYSIEAIDAENAGACLFIRDKVTGLTHNLAQSAYVFTISDTTQAPRFELLLCPRYAQNPTAVTEFTKNNSVQVGHENGNLLVKTNFASTTAGTISVFNLLGQQVIAPIRFNEQSQLHAIAIEGSNDVLVVRITSEEGTITRKVMMK